MRWKCGYGHYETTTNQLTYHVTKQRRLGELVWIALMHNDDTECLTEVPGPLPLNRRQAMHNCETHAREYAHDHH